MVCSMFGGIQTFLEKCKRDRINAFAAQVAFFMLLSAIPLLMVFAALLQYTPVTEGVVLDIAKKSVPEYIAPVVVYVINEVYTKSFGILSVAAIAALWSASKGVHYMAEGLNVVNNIVESRNWFILRLWAVVYTVVFVAAISLMLVLMVFGKSIHAFFYMKVPWLEHIISTILSFRGLLMMGILIILFTVIYKYIPNRKQTFRSQFPGAVLCALAWYGLSFGMSIYVDYFNGFSMYGSLTTIVLVMLLMYFCMYALLLCAEFNVVFEGFIHKCHEWRKERQQRIKNSLKF